LDVRSFCVGIAFHECKMRSFEMGGSGDEMRKRCFAFDLWIGGC